MMLQKCMSFAHVLPDANIDAVRRLWGDAPQKKLWVHALTLTHIVDTHAKLHQKYILSIELLWMLFVIKVVE